MTTEPPIPRRQARLSTKVLITWILLTVAYFGHTRFEVSVLLPIATLFLSRLFLWPAFPRLDRIVWIIFWYAQALLLFAPSLESAAVWGGITFGVVAFIFVNDAVLLYRGYRTSHATDESLSG